MLVMLAAGLLIVVMVQGSGRLSDPPQRSSLWRYPADYPGAEPNYDDSSLACGGFAVIDYYHSIFTLTIECRCISRLSTTALTKVDVESAAMR